MKTSLRQNSYEFLEEALQKSIIAESESLHWKYAMLNLVQSVELILKEKLYKDHPILIFKDIDKPKFTVSLRDAIMRLQKISKLKFRENDIDIIHKALDIRNEIVHYEFEINPVECKLLMAKILGFLQYFNYTYMDTNLDKVITAPLWQKVLSIYAYSGELFASAIDVFESENIDLEKVWTCTKCEWDAFVTQDNINTCYVCGYVSDVVICPNCEESFYIEKCIEIQTGDEQFERFCTDCAEEINRREYESYCWEMGE